MNRQIVAEDSGALLWKQGFDVKAKENDVTIEFSGHMVIVSVGDRVIQAWIWRKYGEAEDEMDHNALFRASARLPGKTPVNSGVRSALLVLRQLLAGYLDKVMSDHVEHVAEQAKLGKGGMTEDEMAALGLLDIDTINMLNESVAKVEAAIRDYSAR